jgi:hypothetical protein
MPARLGTLSLAVTASVLSTAAGCRDDAPTPPRRLVDGTVARVASGPFEGVTVPVIITRARRSGTGQQPCAPLRHVVKVVERVGVSGSSVTVVSGDRTVHGCDRTGSGTCGRAFARLRPRQPLDPRLSLTCRDEEGHPIGFAWLVPDADAAYLLVEHDGYAEAYRAMRNIPVRVTTSTVDVARSEARLEVTEHAEDGRLLRVRTVRAQVSG